MSEADDGDNRVGCSQLRSELDKLREDTRKRVIYYSESLKESRRLLKEAETFNNEPFDAALLEKVQRIHKYLELRGDRFKSVFSECFESPPAWAHGIMSEISESLVGYSGFVGLIEKLEKQGQEGTVLVAEYESNCEKLATVKIQVELLHAAVEILTLLVKRI